MVSQTYAPISRVDVDRLYTDDWSPDSWLDLEERAVQLLEAELISEAQSRTLLYGLRALAAQEEAVPPDSGELYLQMRPILETLPVHYA